MGSPPGLGADSTRTVRATHGLSRSANFRTRRSRTPGATAEGSLAGNDSFSACDHRPRVAVKDDSKEWAKYAKELGVNLQRLRVERGLTQERVAYDAGLSRYQYQRMEWGKIGKDTPANPTLKTIMAVAQVLGVTLDELLPQPWPDLHAR